MEQVARCSQCGVFYNAREHSECPYCAQNSHNKDTNDKKPEASSKGFFSIFSKTKGNKPESVEEKKEVVKEKNKEDSMNQGDKDTQKGETSLERDDQSNYMKNIDPTLGIMHTSPVYQDVQQESTAEHVQPKDVPPANINSEKTGDILKRTNDNGETLLSGITRSSKTIGRYIRNTEPDSSIGSEPLSEVTSLAVGWLVCVKGVYFGKIFPLNSGKNSIGRSNEMDIKLLNDVSVSKDCVARIIYDAKNREFSIIPGDSSSLCYVNGTGVYSRMMLNGYEEIELGDSDRNKFIFVPLCNERFNWDRYQ